MLIDTRSMIEDVEKAVENHDVVSTLLKKALLCKEDEKLSVAERDLLSDLVAWLFAVDAAGSVLKVGEILLQVSPSSNKERWEPIELALCQVCLVDEKHGDGKLAAQARLRIGEARGMESALVKSACDATRAKQMHGEHLLDDQIEKARERKDVWREVVVTLAQLKRLCWILAHGGSERLPSGVLEEKIHACAEFLSEHTKVRFSSIYPEA